MSHLFIVSGPSGVGKNTLIDYAIEESPGLGYFPKIVCRDKRPDDRDEEARFVSEQKYDELVGKKQIALPYTLRGKKYGLPVSSLASLKEYTRICALGDFELVKALRDSFETTTIYVEANLETIAQRVNSRQDTSEQKAKSIESGPKHLIDYQQKWRDIFDYELHNGEDLQKAQNELLRIVREETEHTVHQYNFLTAGGGNNQTQAQEELN